MEEEKLLASVRVLGEEDRALLSSVGVRRDLRGFAGWCGVGERKIGGSWGVEIELELGCLRATEPRGRERSREKERSL